MLVELLMAPGFEKQHGWDDSRRSMNAGQMAQYFKGFGKSPRIGLDASQFQSCREIAFGMGKRMSECDD